EPQCNILCAFESAITLRFPITDWKSLFSFVLLFDNSLSLLLPLLHGAGWEGLKHTIECHQSTEGCNRSDRRCRFNYSPGDKAKNIPPNVNNSKNVYVNALRTHPMVCFLAALPRIASGRGWPCVARHVRL
ncbi:hypothetical protein Csa_023892, partial [Cucumis sativus]